MHQSVQLLGEGDEDSELGNPTHGSGHFFPAFVCPPEHLPRISDALLEPQTDASFAFVHAQDLDRNFL